MKDVRLITIFVILLLAGWRVPAQSYVRWNVSSLYSDHSTIREWRSGLAVGYAKETSGGSCFFLLDSSLSVLKKAILPNNVRVNDFRILHDTVFFCGEDVSLSHGIVGFADINSLFTMPNSINYCELYNPSVPSTYVASPKRMDVYTCAGVTCIAFVGEMLSGSTVGSAHFDGAAWRIYYYSNTTGAMAYHDVAASSDYVAVAIKKNSSPNYYVQVFHTSVIDMLSAPLNMGYVYRLTGSTPSAGMRLADISPIEFALAYHYMGASLAGTEVQLFRVDPPTNTVVVYTTLNYIHGSSYFFSPSSWMMKEMGYDAAMQHLLLLHDVSNTTVTSVESSVFRYDMTNYGQVEVSYTAGVTMNGIDASASGGYYTIGTESGDLAIAREVYAAAGACRQMYRPSIACSLDAAVTTEWPEDITTLTNVNLILPSILRYETIDIDCEE